MIRCLVVDDYEPTRDGLASLLQRHGYEVCTGIDLVSGLACFNTFTPHLAMIDISLPHHVGEVAKKENGFALARYIKERHPNTGVCLWSASKKYDLQPELQDLLDEFPNTTTFKEKTGSFKDDYQTLQDLLARCQAITSPPVALPEGISHIFGIGQAEQPYIEKGLSRVENLSERDWELLNLVAQSASSRGAGEILGLGPGSIDNQISSIYRLLGLDDIRTQAPHLRQLILLVKIVMVYHFQQSANQQISGERAILLSTTF